MLSIEPPIAFEKSSGSTSASKYLPYTRSLLAEFAAATGPWIHDLLARRPAVARGSAYWSISPAARKEERTPGGVRVGLADDTEYFPPFVRRLLRVLLPVPPDVARLPDIDRCRDATLRHLFADPHLALISVWNPSFLTLLLEAGAARHDSIARDLDPRRADCVRAAFAVSGRPDLRRLWPELALVSCWTDADAARALPALKRLLPPGVEIQGKGLLATEGVVSIPLLGHTGAVLAVASHVLELEPAGEPGARPLAPHEAEVGGRYLPILTTGGGHYRYRLGDVVEAIGRFRRTPRVRFVGRADGVSDQAGEKLSPGRVAAALAAAIAACGTVPTFALLAPTPGEPPASALYVEADADERARAALARELEARLREGHHYDGCRALGQLGPVAAVPVRDGALRYERALVARGAKAGDVKPACLHRGLFWREVFADA